MTESKKKHIDYWLSSADESWSSAELLVQGGGNMMALFCYHLCIEKLLKAHWIKDNTDDFPPRTHNLNWLHDQTHLHLSNELQEELKLINYWNIEGRYPDYRQKIYKAATTEYIESKKEILQTIRKCLTEKLQ